MTPPCPPQSASLSSRQTCRKSSHRSRSGQQTQQTGPKPAARTHQHRRAAQRPRGLLPRPHARALAWGSPGGQFWRLTCENGARESRERGCGLKIFLTKISNNKCYSHATYDVSAPAYAARSPSALDPSTTSFSQPTCHAGCELCNKRSDMKQNGSVMQWGCVSSHRALTGSAQAPACQQSISHAHLQ